MGTYILTVSHMLDAFILSRISIWRRTPVVVDIVAVDKSTFQMNSASSIESCCECILHVENSDACIIWESDLCIIWVGLGLENWLLCMGWAKKNSSLGQANLIQAYIYAQFLKLELSGESRVIPGVRNSSVLATANLGLSSE